MAGVLPLLWIPYVAGEECLSTRPTRKLGTNSASHAHPRLDGPRSGPISGPVKSNKATTGTRPEKRLGSWSAGRNPLIWYGVRVSSASLPSAWLSGDMSPPGAAESSPTCRAARGRGHLPSFGICCSPSLKPSNPPRPRPEPVQEHAMRPSDYWYSLMRRRRMIARRMRRARRAAYRLEESWTS